MITSSALELKAQLNIFKLLFLRLILIPVLGLEPKPHFLFLILSTVKKNTYTFKKKKEEEEYI